MPQKNKVAKKRLDKFYYLAKERGYRSRAAFKLLQLDKKYELLSKSSGVLDLCAAPGSWMQVARQYMPKDSVVIGIDRAPMKPVPKCVALQEDITTQRCRAAIKRELQATGGGKIDLVLHDGAPNVGTTWLQDAFDQNELTLHALKLAVDILVPGGSFVTKTFRSNDYNSLLWVFGQLFSKVEATKPQASRNESAEIFVVCLGFKNAKIDPKFLDPKHVFQQTDEAVPAANVLQAKKGKKARPEGYDQPGQVLRSTMPVKDFVLGTTPVKHLSEAYAFTWNESAECVLWKDHPLTKPDILHSCQDLKVLGKGDFRRLLAWRLKMTAAWKAANKADGDDPEADGTPADEADSEADEAREEDEISELQKLASQRVKAAKRRASETRNKFKERLALKMEHPGDRLDVGEDLELFSLLKVKGGGAALDAVLSGVEPDDLTTVEHDTDISMQAQSAAGDDDDDDDDETSAADKYTQKLDEQLEQMYAQYQERTRRRAKHAMDAEDAGLSKKAQRSAKRSALTEAEVDPAELARQVAAKQFANSDDEDDINMDEDGDDDDDDDDDEDNEDDEDQDRLRRKRRRGEKNELITDLHNQSSRSAAKREEKDSRTSRWFGQSLFDGLDDDGDEQAVSEMAERARSKRHSVDATTSPAAADEEDDDEENEENEEGTSKMDASSAAVPSSKRVRSRKRRGPDAASAEAARAAAAAAAKVKAGGVGAAAALGVPEDGFFEDVPQDGTEKKVGGRFAQWDSDDEDADGNSKRESSQAAISRQAEAMVLGQMLLRGEKRRKLEDGGYNRHTFNDRGLPSWFVDDEARFSAPAEFGVDLPDDMVTKAKEALKSINAHSIKKVAEAQARKKRRMQRALTKVRKKANALADKSDLSEREKAREVEKLYKKKLTVKKESKKLVVGRAFQAGSGGKKGKNIKMVDARTRSDTRGDKRKASREKAGVKGGRKGPKQHKAKTYNRSKRK